MLAEQSSLTILNAHAAQPKVYWNGIEVLGVQRVRLLSDEDAQRVKLVVSGAQTDIYQSMRDAGVSVKEL